MIDAVVLDAVGAYGFPIVAFLLMFWMNVSVIKETTKAARENSETNKELLFYLKSMRGEK